MINKTLPILLSFLLTACAVGRPPVPVTHAPTTQPEPPKHVVKTEEDVLYPTIDAETQINQLGIQLARLEQQVQTLQTRVQQLERRNQTRTTSTLRPRSTASSISADEAAQTQQIQQNAAQTLQRAQSQYQSGQFKAAVETLKHAESGGDGSDTARKSMYLLMQSHQRLNNCESAINIGNRFVGRFRNSQEAPEALFNVGQCQYNMQQRDIAKVTWRKLIQTYPDSFAAKRAHQQLNKK
ncbi:tetratricopeptide repeat protein [Neisseria wadsworthii]|uniref:Tetratricopeptide repeat protein n=1 Tax=Neisseria wadsworthii 9715 TaxID=1030841 RepID=G4CRD2_9NEIS|nr:tetratricopeptide repeat protein [Neisseria wadsworthii]EGZ45352.1 hypothetical protein HMPREF9370_1642 [Neisseria wadsworthii 9715]QMT35340.1 tetratricopeptide repeat protein [Neisseria wadsworthii]